MAALLLQALVFSPTLFHSASREGSVCRVDGDADPTVYGDGGVSLGNCAPVDTGGWNQLYGSHG